MSDLIRREDAIEAVRLATVETRSIGRGDILYILYSIPSAEQVTGKLKNPCDSLLKTDSEACKEQKSKLDLISRQDAIDAVTGAIWHYHNECYKNLNVYEVAEALVSDAIKLLPSRITEYKTFCGVPIEEAARIVQEHNAEPKTGEWVLKEHLWECDQCGCRINRANPLKGNVWNYNFCPNCGCKMQI